MFYAYFEHVSSFSVAFPFLLILFSGKKNLQSPLLKVLAILLLIAACSDLGSYILINMGKSNLVVDNSFIIAQFLLLSYIYFRVLPNKKWVYGGLVLFISFFIINTSFIQPFTVYQGWMRFAGGIILIGYASMSSFHFMNTDDFTEDKIPFFNRLIGWINLAVLVYFAANLFSFSASELFAQLDRETAMMYWSFHNVTNILKNILFAIGIYYTGRKGGDQNVQALEEMRGHLDKRYDITMFNLERNLKELKDL